MSRISMLQNHFIMSMAGLTIEMDTPSPRTCILCRNYLSNDAPDISIKVDKKDIQREQLEFNCCKDDEVTLEISASYRKIVEKVIDYNLILIHGAVIAIGNSAFMFSAPSGTGKTTHIKKWLINEKRSFVVNGDKPLIKITDTEVIACGTPWCGNEHLGNNIMVPLKSIVLLERAENNYIEEIPFIKAYPFLLGQTHIPESPDNAKKAIDLLSKLYEKVSFYKFQCNNFKDDCFNVSYNTLVVN